MGHSRLKPLRITCCIRALAPSELDVRASGIAIRLRPHDGIGFHVTAAMGPKPEKRTEIRIRTQVDQWQWDKRMEEKKKKRFAP